MKHVLLKELVELTRRNKDGSYSTQAARKDILVQCGKQLLEAGFRDLGAAGLKQKHWKGLLERWQREGLSAATIKNRMTQLRWWAEKIGKQNLIPRTNTELGIERRRYVTNISRALELPTAALDKITNERLRVSLELQAALGLRREECLKVNLVYALDGKTVAEATSIRLKDSFHKDQHGPKEKVDLIVLAGDIHIGLKAFDVAAWYRKRFDVPVIFVAGNHEFYKADLDNMINELRLATAHLDGVYFLENDSVEIGCKRFLGCTLWSDFAIQGPDRTEFAKAKAAEYMTDFQVIQYLGLQLTPKDVVQRFQSSFSWLEQELAKPFDGDTVVITHFAPHKATIHPDYLVPGADELTPYFTSDCASLMQQYSIRAWLYGHSHNSVDTFVEKGTRLVSNQRGYPGERWTYTRFEWQKIIEL